MLQGQVLMERTVVCSDAHHVEDGRLMSQSLSPGKMGDSCLKVHLPTSVEAGVFITSERRTEQRDQGRGLKSFLCADEHSPFQQGK